MAQVIKFPSERRDHEPWVTKAQLAAHLALSERWINYRMREGLPSRMLGGSRRFRISEVDRWLLRRER